MYLEIPVAPAIPGSNQPSNAPNKLCIELEVDTGYCNKPRNNR